MASNVKLSVAATNAMLDTLAGLMTSGSLSIYTAPRPATPETAPGAATLLATLAMLGVPFAPAAASSAASNGFVDGPILANGTANWARLSNNAGVGVLDGDVGVTGSGKFIELATLALLTSDGPISVVGLNLNLPIT